MFSDLFIFYPITLIGHANPHPPSSFNYIKHTHFLLKKKMRERMMCGLQLMFPFN